MEKVRIKFVDFWTGFTPSNNYFYYILSKYFLLELSEEPEVLIYSCYGKEYLDYKCLKIFYTAENLRPDFTGCDFAVSFDYNQNVRHFRLPLYILYIQLYGAMEALKRPISIEDARAIWKSKTKFCCMVVSNIHAKKRLNFFEKLSKYRQVDSGGKIMNNIGGAVNNKMEFIKDYRFVISFENSSYPGYTTEKIIEPLIAHCIPIYWGNPLISKDINRKCFLNMDPGKGDESLIEQIIELDNNEEAAIEMIRASKLAEDTTSEIEKEHAFGEFLRNIIMKRAQLKTVSNPLMQSIHSIKLSMKYIWTRIKNSSAGVFIINITE